MPATRRGSELIEYDARHDYILAKEPIGIAVGVVEPHTIALNHYQHIGRTREGTEIIQEQIWLVGGPEWTRLERQMDCPRESG